MRGRLMKRQSGNVNWNVVPLVLLSAMAISPP
jgi:hypothetical protein